MTSSRLIIGALVLVGVGALGWVYLAPPANRVESANPATGLSPQAQAGKLVFEANCARCHGVGAVGTDNGPPLKHQIYNPGHHDDGAFYRAARQGTPQHHWRFGNMPPQPQVSDREIGEIIRYIREIQVAAGITYKPHRM